MPNVPEEVVVMMGTEGNDLMVANQAALTALNAVDVLALGGDDSVIRDRTGGYSIHDGSYGTINVQGDGGADLVSYVWLSSGITANLVSGWTFQHLPDNAPVGQVAYGYDLLSGFERLNATNYDDDVLGSGAAERFWGNDGDDTLGGAGGNDTVWGGEGDDQIDGGTGNDTVWGGNGSDDIVGGTGNDSLKGEDGDDEIDGGTGHDSIYGGEDDDTIDGGGDNDIIYAGDGQDDIEGGSGNDTIYLDDGSDTVDGGLSNDVIHVSGFGNHDIDGGAGVDKAVFAGGATTVNLNAGFVSRADGVDDIVNVENIETGSSLDNITGSNGNNHIKTNSGSDTVYALNGNDTVLGDGGHDTIFGQGGVDQLNGGSGNDELDGGSGNDVISGQSGADYIRGGEGADTMTGGGAGVDVFAWEVNDLGYDLIQDFDLDEDKLHFGEGFFAAGPGGAVDLSDVLVALDFGVGGTFLMANTSWAGWQPIANVGDVSDETLGQMIANGSILDVELAGGDGPGGLSGSDGGFDGFGVQLGLIL
jgi:Ca2+-binding RTX toxin-like protein